MYDLAWPLGFCISAFAHAVLSWAFPPVGLGDVDETDVFGTFSAETERSDVDSESTKEIIHVQTLLL